MRQNGTSEPNSNLDRSEDFQTLHKFLPEDDIVSLTLQISEKILVHLQRLKSDFNKIVLKSPIKKGLFDCKLTRRLFKLHSCVQSYLSKNTQI